MNGHAFEPTNKWKLCMPLPGICENSLEPTTVEMVVQSLVFSIKDE
jgi:hypothetical protein